MITGNSNSPDKSGANVPEQNATTSVTEIANKNKEMFTQYADLVTPAKNMVDKDQTMIDKTVKDRVIDLSSVTNAMQTTKLNLMKNGKLVLSMTQDGNMFYHAITPKERNQMSDILNNQNMDDGLKLMKLNSLMSGIALTTQLQYNFEKNASQGESHSMHR